MSETARIMAVSRLDCRLEAHDWPFTQERRPQIEARWQRLVAEKPTVFNGRVLALRDWRLDDGLFSGAFFETDYASLTAWLDFGSLADGAINAFAMAALCGSDGGYVLGEMNVHTAQAGKIYFPAGTPDLGDVDGERVDLAGSVLRELQEETSLTAADVTLAPGWTAVLIGKKLALMREARSPLPARELKAVIDAELARDPQSELARMHVVDTPAAIDADRMPPFQVAFLEAMLAARRA